MLVWWLLGMHSDGDCIVNNMLIRWQYRVMTNSRVQMYGSVYQKSSEALAGAICKRLASLELLHIC